MQEWPKSRNLWPAILTILMKKYLPPSDRALRRLLQLHVRRLHRALDLARRLWTGLLLLPGRARGQEQDQGGNSIA